MAKSLAYQEAKKLIEEARREGETELDLSGMALTEVPEEIAQLSNLQMLYLQNNQLTRIPEVIAQLSQLKGLSLYHNQIKEIPEEF